jgi:predicted transcriptional regulator
MTEKDYRVFVYYTKNYSAVVGIYMVNNNNNNNNNNNSNKCRFVSSKAYW